LENIRHVKLSISEFTSGFLWGWPRLFVGKQVIARSEIVGPARLKTLVHRMRILAEATLVLPTSIVIVLLWVEGDVLLLSVVSGLRKHGVFVHFVDRDEGRRGGILQVSWQLGCFVTDGQTLGWQQSLWVKLLRKQELGSFKRGRFGTTSHWTHNIRREWSSEIGAVL